MGTGVSGLSGALTWGGIGGMHAPRSRRQVCADSGIRVLIVSEGAAAVAVALCRMSGSPVVPLFPSAEVETLVSTCCFAGYFSSRLYCP